MSNLNDILNDVIDNGAEYGISKGGKPVAVIVPADKYDSIVETVEILSDPEAMAAIAEAEGED